MKKRIFALAIGLSTALVAGLAGAQELGPEDSPQAQKAKHEQEKLERKLVYSTSPWTCGEMSWVNEPRLADDVSQLTFPGEAQPTGESIPRAQYKNGMIIAEVRGRCETTSPLPVKQFPFTADGILKDYIEAKEVLAGPQPGTLSDGTPAVKYLVKTRDYDDDKKPLDLFMWVTIGVDNARSVMHIQETLDHVNARPGDHGDLLKKFRGDATIRKTSEGGVEKLALDSYWGIWAANPRSKTLVKIFFGRAKKALKEINTDWRDGLFTFALKNIDGIQAK